MSEPTIRENIVFHWAHSKLILIIFLIPAIALCFLIVGLISIGEFLDIVLIASLVAVTIRYTKWTYKIVEINRKLLIETRKETFIRDLRVKLQNFYTPLYLRYYDNSPRKSQILFKYLDTKDNEQYYMNRNEKENFEKIIYDNLHFADDDLEKGLNEILNCTNDFTIPKERCNTIASLIKAGYERYKKEYGELISPKDK